MIRMERRRRRWRIVLCAIGMRSIDEDEKRSDEEESENGMYRRRKSNYRSDLMKLQTTVCCAVLGGAGYIGFVFFEVSLFICGGVRCTCWAV